MDMKFGQKVTGKTKVHKTGTTFSSGLRDLAYSGLLPTPAAFDRKTCHQKVKGKTITRESGETFTAGLRMLASNGLLPTPTARCYNAGTTKERKDGISRLSELNHLVAHSAGTGSQLSPLFCEEMMGFPRFYTVYPFLAGEKNQ